MSWKAARNSPVSGDPLPGAGDNGCLSLGVPDVGPGPNTTCYQGHRTPYTAQCEMAWPQHALRPPSPPCSSLFRHRHRLHLRSYHVRCLPSLTWKRCTTCAGPSLAWSASNWPPPLFPACLAPNLLIINDPGGQSPGGKPPLARRLVFARARCLSAPKPVPAPCTHPLLPSPPLLSLVTRCFD